MSQPLSDIASDEKHRTAKLAADVWNVIDDEPDTDGLETPIRTSDIKVTQCHRGSKHGHILGTSTGIKLGINYSWWEKQRDERLLVFLAHEYAHITDETNGLRKGSHKPNFWYKHLEHAEDVMMGVDRIDAIDSIDPHAIADDIHGSVNPGIVDRRCMSTDECRQMVEDYFPHLL
jgi:hypothetical protein